MLGELDRRVQILADVFFTRFAEGAFGKLRADPLIARLIIGAAIPCQGFRRARPNAAANEAWYESVDQSVRQRT